MGVQVWKVHVVFELLEIEQGSVLLKRERLSLASL